MSILHLIRHGQTNWNAERRIQGQSESELDDTGRQQADMRRPAIEALGITAVYSSSSIRARQTTEILNRNMALPVTYLDSLREIFLGPWETRLWEDIHASEPEAAEAFHLRPHEFSKPDTECYTQLRDRGVVALEQIFTAQPQGQVLVVSHGALLRATMTHYAKVGLHQLCQLPFLSNCSHSILKASPAKRRKLTHIDGVPLSKTEWSR